MAKTKIIAEFLRRSTAEDGSTEITFKVSDYNYKSYVQDLEHKTYALEINDVKRKRTIQQNRYLWKLIHEIAEKENGHLKDEMETYCALLERANAKYEYIKVLDDAVDTLKSIAGMRAMHVVKREEENGKVFAVCKCYIGSSKFDTKEMQTLIDCTLDYAEQIGIDTTFYNDVLTNYK